MDDDDKQSEDEAAEPAPDAAQEEGAKLREVSEEELKRLLAAQAPWVETDGEEGERADLSRTDLQDANLVSANLQGINFQGADLQDANLYRANLQGANFTGANLQGAVLFEADLRNANLRNANLQGADLEEANLTNAEGLTREQLDEACGDNQTQLPDYLADYRMKPCPEPAQSPSN